MIFAAALAVGLTLLAAALVLWPLLHASADRRGSAQQVRLAALAARLRGAEQAFAAGTIDQDTMQREQREIAAEAAQSLAPGATGAGTAPRPWAVGLIVALLLPAGVWLTYLSVGDPASLLGAGARAMAQDAGVAEQAARTEELAARLKARLADGSDDTEAWVLLARTYRAAGDLDHALDAYKHAAGHAAATADMLVEYASALVDRNGRRFDDASNALVTRALAAEPGNLNALAMAGAAAMQRGDRAAALGHWRKLHDAIPQDNTDDRARAARLVALASGEPIAADPATNMAPAAAGAAANMAPVPPGAGQMAAAGTDAGDAAPVPPPAANTAGARISGVVSVASALADRLPAGATLFVFARSPDGAPMPIAALRLHPSSFPVAFALDDSHSMVQGRRLSGFDSVRLSARVSRGGDAARHPGDIEGNLDRVTLGSGNVRLVLDHIVE